MRSVKIEIPGKFYDSFIYNGNLLLWDINGDIIFIEWAQMLNDKFLETSNYFAYSCAFLHGDYLYGDRWKRIFQDDDIKQLIQKKFCDLDTFLIDVTKQDRYIQKYKNPFPFPHADCLIYKSRYIKSKNPCIFISTSDGIFSSSYYKRSGGRLFNYYKNSQKLHDIPCFNLEPRSSTIALACGDEGTWCFELSKHALKKLSSKHTTWVNWAFSDIFSTSYYNSGYLLTSEISDESKIFYDRFQFKPITFTGETKDAKYIFNNSGLSWGVDDKICMINNGSLEIKRYKRHPKDGENKFFGLTTISDNIFNMDELIKSSSAPWGYILEYKTKIIVLKSNGETEIIEHNNQEITNWRIFTRSVRYSNQLHVIFEDNISIYSFNDDYFENQFEKKIGIRYLLSSF